MYSPDELREKLARQHNIQTINHLVKGPFAFKRHADNAPDHHFKREQRSGHNPHRIAVHNNKCL
jgi:hypothetical protein